MATMYITEYSHIASDKNGSIVQAGKSNGNETYQQITFTGTHGSSAAFKAGTNLIRVVCDADAFLNFGLSPTAITLTHTPIKADTPEFFGVVAGQKVSAVI